jgi:hypothetical protein
MFGEEMGNYVLATTTETDQSGPKKPGAINGGFFPKRPDWPAQHPNIVIAVEDIQAAIEQGIRRAETGSRRPAFTANIPIRDILFPVAGAGRNGAECGPLRSFVALRWQANVSRRFL